jgi:hypothetical protein
MDNPLNAALGDEPEVEVAPVEAVNAESPQPAEGGLEARGPEPGHVPLAAVLDEREKRQAAERQLRELQQWREQLEAAQAQPLPLDQALAQQRYQDNLRYSRKFAERQHGKDFVDQVHQWAFDRCERDPYFNAEMAAHDDPYEAAAQAYNREQVLKEVGHADLDAFRAWKATQAQAQATPQPGAPMGHAAPKPPPVSLANASGTGALGAAAVPSGDGEAYASLFRK